MFQIALSSGQSIYVKDDVRERILKIPSSQRYVSIQASMAGGGGNEQSMELFIDSIQFIVRQ